MKPIDKARRGSAMRVVASSLGVLVGLAGIEHGIFELFQGNVAPASAMIEAIGPAQRFWEYGTERALTVAPTFLASGILAILLGLLVTIWAALFVATRHGASVLLALSIALFLVGGGFAPIFMSITATVAATGVDKPLAWWRTRLAGKPRSVLARLWPSSLIAFVLVFVVSVEIAIFGYPLVSFLGADTTYAVQSALALVMLALMIFCVLVALAHDIDAHSEAA